MDPLIASGGTCAPITPPEPDWEAAQEHEKWMGDMEDAAWDCGRARGLRARWRAYRVLRSVAQRPVRRNYELFMAEPQRRIENLMPVMSAPRGGIEFKTPEEMTGGKPVPKITLRTRVEARWVKSKREARSRCENAWDALRGDDGHDRRHRVDYRFPDGRDADREWLDDDSILG